jgi:hypothetical protein
MSKWTGPDRDHDYFESRADEHQPMSYRLTVAPDRHYTGQVSAQAEIRQQEHSPEPEAN